MKKTILITLALLLMINIVNVKLVHSAEIDNYNVKKYNNLVMKKGEKIKLSVSYKKNIKWSCSSNKVKITKRGIVKARKVGIVKIKASTEKGKKYICKIRIKNKIAKASKNNISLVINKVENSMVEFQISNNSDKCIVAEPPYLEYRNDNNWEGVSKKAIYNDRGPHITLQPKGIYKQKFSLSNYDIGNGEYKLIFNVHEGTLLSKTKNRFTIEKSFYTQ